MTRHSRRVIPASLVALVILGACVVVAVSVIQHLSGHPPLLPFAAMARHARTLRLDGTVMVTAGAVAAGLGVILLGCALIPGRTDTLALADVSAGDQDSQQAPGKAADAGVNRRGLRNALAATAADIEGVAAARIRVRRRRVTAAVRTEMTDSAAARAAVEDALRNRLSQTALGWEPELRIVVRNAAQGAAG